MANERPMTAAEVIFRERLWREERWPELVAIQLRMDEFVVLTLGVLNRELRWKRVCRRWEAKHETV